MQRRLNHKGFRRVDVQVAIFTMVATIISCTLISVLYFYTTHADMIRSLEDRVYAIQDFVTNSIDKRMFSDINSPSDIDSELYKETHIAFNKIQDVTDVMYLYTAKRNDEGKFVYVVDCIDPSAEDFRHPGDPIEPEIIPEMQRALDGQDVMPHSIKNTEWGKIFVAYLPVKADDEVIGVIGVEFEAKHQYNTYTKLGIATPIVASIICFLCSLVARILFQRISNPLFRDMYNTDYLTNLKSRNAFTIDVDNLGQRKNYQDIGFYVIDLNNLKKVNDSLGHDAGDLYLQAAAQSFRDTAGKRAAIYRTGGDEFVLLSTDATLEQMKLMTEELCQHFEQNKPEWDIDLSFSIGYAVYDPDLDPNLSATYRRADMMMYQNKRAFHAQHSI